MPTSGGLHLNSGGGCEQHWIKPTSEHLKGSTWQLGGAHEKEHHDEVHACYKDSFREHRQQSIPQPYSPSSGQYML